MLICEHWGHFGFFDPGKSDCSGITSSAAVSFATLCMCQTKHVLKIRNILEQN